MAKRRPRREIKKGSSYSSEYRELKKAFDRFYKYKTYKNALKVYKKMAKRADQRLVRLEKAAQTPGFENILAYSYRRAAADAASWDQAAGNKPGSKPRFNRNTPKTLAGLKSKMTDIERFLLSATSTKAGTEEVYKKRAEKINKIAGIRKNSPDALTWEDMQAYYGSETSAEMKEAGYGSNTIIRAIGTLKKNKGRLTPEKIKEANKNNLRMSRDRNVDYVASEMLRRGFNVNMFEG